MAEARVVEGVKRLARLALSSPDHPWITLRFLAVGGLGTVSYTAVSTFFALVVHLSGALSSMLAYGVCVPPTYLAQHSVTFRAQTPHSRSFVRYVLMQIPLLISAAVWAHLLVDRWHWHAALSFLLIGPAHAVLSFIIQKAWAFAHK